MEPQAFENKIAALGLERYFSITVDSPDGAKRVLSDVREVQKQLRQIKREINVAMKAIRTEYSRRATDVANKGALLELFSGKKAAGRLRAADKQQLAEERDRLLAPYEQLKLAIDQRVTALDDIKNQLGRYIEQERAALTTVKEAAKTAKSQTPRVSKEKAAFCPECGNTIGPADRFCRHCGHRLDESKEVPPPDIIYPPGQLGG